VIYIDKSLKVKIYQNQQIVPVSAYSHIISCDTPSLFSKLNNLMGFSRNHSPNTTVSEVHLQENLAKFAQAYIEKTQNDQKIRLLKFPLAQFTKVKRIDLLISKVKRIDSYTSLVRSLP